MSPAKRHAAACADKSFAVLGTDSLTIEGSTVDFVLGEESTSKDYESVGYDTKTNLTAVCKLAEFPAIEPLKKIATINGKKYRVENTRKKEPFLILILEEITKG
jgi:hypothetical protein